MSPRARRCLRLVVLLSALLLVSACVLLPDFAGQYKAGKYEPVEQVTKPSATASAPTAESQAEPHTCGLHAMRSMYAAYGLAPDHFQLRFRLGTDEPATRVDKDSTGTLHPDLYRVLAQDGFAIDTLDLEAAVASSALQNHLAWDQLALAVVYRGTYHWVLLGPADETDGVIVYDSLEAEPGRMPIEALLADALSITLIGPSTGEPMPTSDAHALGLAEMARLYQRKE